MTGVFVDETDVSFCVNFNVRSVGEIMLFNRSLYEFAVFNTLGLNIDNYIILSDNKKFYKNEKNLFNKKDDLMEFVKNSDEDEYIYLELKMFFSLDESAFYEGRGNYSAFALIDDFGEFFGFYGKKADFLNYLEIAFGSDGKSNTEILKDHPSVKCINYGVVLKSLKDYKNLVHNCLSEKYQVFLPEVAEGVYTNDKIPDGEYNIIPPVYFGKNVQIEKGSVIGPNTVIYDSVLVSSDSVLKNTVVLSGGYVSSGCYIDGAICCDNVSIRRNSAVFKGTVIGSGSLLSEEVFLENGSVIPSGSMVNEMKKDKKINSEVVKNERGKGSSSVIDREYSVERGVEWKLPLSRAVSLAGEFGDVDYINGEIFGITENSIIKYKMTAPDKLKILVDAASFEIADEIASDIERLFGEYKP